MNVWCFWAVHKSGVFVCEREREPKKCWAPPLTHLSHIFQCATFWRRAANHEHSIFVVIRSHLFTNIGAVLFNIRWHFVRLSICPAIHSPFDGDAPIFESLFLSRRISVRFFPLLCPFEIMQMSKLVHKYPCSFYCAA